MRLLEYQAKELFKKFDIPVLDGKTSFDITTGKKHAKILKYPFVIKAQVPVGGRGKAGGIQVCKNDDEFNLKYTRILDMTIKGEKTRAILLEKMANIKQELYLSIFLNRGKRCYTIIASSDGGVEIESVKNQIVKEIPIGLVPQNIAKDVAKQMNLTGKHASTIVEFLKKLAKLAKSAECELVEINPLAILDDGDIVALDGKVITDDNSNFRHPELAKYNDMTESEKSAEKYGFTLVELDGNVAVVGNGAGLVMATLDMLSDHGGKPACFLDVGGGATTESVYRALVLISKMKHVKSILINLYGGIVKTTTVAAAFIKAYDDGVINLKVFARLMGTESEKSKVMLKNTKIQLYDNIEQAITAAVAKKRRLK